MAVTISYLHRGPEIEVQEWQENKLQGIRGKEKYFRGGRFTGGYLSGGRAGVDGKGPRDGRIGWGLR
jgi:hypothetical protein